MTEKEAIAYIKAIKNGLHETGKDFPYRDEIIPVAKEALEMAIKALEQQPTDAVDRVTIKEYLESFGKVKTEQEPCDDCISRQAVAEVLLKYAHSTEGKTFAEFLVSQINDLPSVIPQPKMGKWIEHFDESGKWYECDRCHTDWGGSVNYCPNCGSKM